MAISAFGWFAADKNRSLRSMNQTGNWKLKETSDKKKPGSPISFPGYLIVVA